MQQELSCDQVGALMTFYIEDKLSDQLAQYVKRHLNICPSCREKYETLKTMVSKFIEMQNKPIDNLQPDYQAPFITRQYEEFKANLSAYIDNELNDIENIKIKKITISNPLARQDLEDMYTFKKLLHSSFDKTRNEIKNDYSKYVLSQLQQGQESQKTDQFTKIMAIFAAIITCVVIGFISILYL